MENGAELNSDQIEAVDAFDSVVASLEVCQKFASQLEEILVEKEKYAKHLQKKQQEERLKGEQERVKQVLKFQVSSICNIILDVQFPKKLETSRTI